MKNYLEIIGGSAVCGLPFLFLKYFGYIDISWWGATFLYWWWIAFGLFALLCYGVLYFTGKIIEAWQE